MVLKEASGTKYGQNGKVSTECAQPACTGTGYHCRTVQYPRALALPARSSLYLQWALAAASVPGLSTRTQYQDSVPGLRIPGLSTRTQDTRTQDTRTQYQDSVPGLSTRRLLQGLNEERAAVRCAGVLSLSPVRCAYSTPRISYGWSKTVICACTAGTTMSGLAGVGVRGCTQGGAG